MKTLKLALVAAFVAFTMTSVSYADGFRSNPKFKKVVNVSYTNAVENSGLVFNMYQQIHPADVFGVHQFDFVAEVKYRESIYRIHGTKEQWAKFFLQKGTRDSGKKSKGPVTE